MNVNQGISGKTTFLTWCRTPGTYLDNSCSFLALPARLKLLSIMDRPSFRSTTRQLRLAEASRQKRVAEAELCRKELAILRLELELERELAERAHAEAVGRIEQDATAMSIPLPEDLEDHSTRNVQPTQIQQPRAASLQVHVHPHVPNTMTDMATLGQITQPAVAHAGASAPKSPALSTHQLLQTAALDSESARDQAPSTAETVTESETTNRYLEFATIAAPTPTSPTKAAPVPDRTAQTPASSSTSKSLCDHAQNRIIKLMIEAPRKDGSSPSPAPNDRVFLNHNRPESKPAPTPTSTTSVMTTPSAAAKVPPVSHYRLTRGSSSHATTQSIHGSPTGLYHHHLSAEVSAQHPTAMDKNNNVSHDSSPLSIVQPLDLEGAVQHSIFDSHD